MRPPRFTIAGLMIAVVAVAVGLSVYRAFWFWGFVALAPFGLSALDSPLERNRSVRGWVLLVGVLGTLVLPFLVAIAINHDLWGYYLSKPPVDRKIVEARSIESITYVQTEAGPDGGLTFAGAPVRHPEVMGGRVFRDLKARDALPANPPIMPADRLGRLHRALDETGRLEVGEPGYDEAKHLAGVAIEAKDRDGRPIVFVGVGGGEVSNDHHPYYEFLFTTDPSERRWELLSFHRTYYDVAGIEGAEWPLFFLLLAWMGLIPTRGIQGLVLRLGRRRSPRSDATSEGVSG